MNKDIPILIIGAGSIGERHIRNLFSLGYQNLYVYRQRNLPYRDIGNAQPVIIMDWSEIVKLNAEIAFICTPTNQHLQQTALCIEYGMHVFTEKPLSHTLENFDSLRNVVQHNHCFLQIGFMMRFHPAILKIKKIIESGIYGNLKSMSFHWGSYLPDWHPWEKYKESYAANRSMGGGVALTLCHDIDLAIWLAGATLKSHSTKLIDVKELGIEAESIANINLEFENQVTAFVHLNYIEKPPKHSYIFNFSDAIIEFDYFKNSIITKQEGNELITPATEHTYERNALFIDELHAFISLISSQNDAVAYSLNQINESEQIIKICTS